MALLSSAQLTTMRAQATASLDRTCTLRTVALGASDAAGGFSAEITGDVTVACRIAPPRGSDRTIAERLSVDMDSVLTLPYGTSVAVTSRVIDQSTDVEYEIVHGNPDQSYKTATRAYLKRVA